MQILDLNPYDRASRTELIRSLIAQKKTDEAYSQALILWNQGYRDKEGRYYDAKGTFKGTVKEDGMFYDTAGNCLGYTSGKKWPFDPLGNFVPSKKKD